MTDPADRGARPPLHPLWSWAGLVPAAAAFLAMTLMSWRRWGDVLVDFGFQLYMPWQITEGKALYRDGGWMFGPLSQYYDALLFLLFGVSYTTIVVAGLCLIAILAILVYAIFRRAADAVTAGAATMALLVVFALAQYGPNGNYNYIAPYCFETVHGLFLSIVAIGVLGLWIARGHPGLAALAGLCFGLVYLTKVEVFVALAAPVAAAFVMVALLRKGLSFAWKAVPLFLVGAALPVVIAELALTRVLGVPEGLPSPLSGASAQYAVNVAANPFYLWCLGLDNPVDNVVAMFQQFGVVMLVTSGCFFACRWTPGRFGARQAGLLLVPVGVVVAATRFNWADAGRSLPLLALAIGVHLAATWRGSDSADARKKLAGPILWSLFSLFLLAKMGLNSRIWHYGFVLAMPATLLVVYYFLWFLPDSLRRFGVSFRLFRVVMLAVLAVALVDLARLSYDTYRLRDFPVGKGDDRMMVFGPGVDPRGLVLEKAVEWLESNTLTGATVAALPEGIMLNYLARRPSPTAYHSVVMAAGVGALEAPVVARFAEVRPDYIALVQRDASEFGLPAYGQSPDYGRTMMDWVDRNYTSRVLFGDDPLGGTGFGIRIFQRDDLPALHGPNSAATP